MKKTLFIIFIISILVTLVGCASKNKLADNSLKITHDDERLMLNEVIKDRSENIIK